jgi:hypothetical protein
MEISKESLEFLARVEEPGHNGAQGAAEMPGNFLVGKILDLLKNDDSAVLGAQCRKGFLNTTFDLSPI